MSWPTVMQPQRSGGGEQGHEFNSRFGEGVYDV